MTSILVINYEPWEPQWPECTISLPDYPRLLLDPSYWTWRIPDSDLQAAAEAKAVRQRAAEARAQELRERHAARAAEDQDIRRGIAAFGRGELKVAPPKPRQRRSGPSVDTLVAMAAGYALRLRDEAADAGVDIPGTLSAAKDAVDAMGVDDRQVSPATVDNHLRSFWKRYR
jgi:hypothetical protein